VKEPLTVTVLPELQQIFELTERVGSDPLLTQASTGNSSIKLDGVLWIKASGRWMSDALRDDIFIPLDLQAVTADCLNRGIDPAACYPNASLETAMHAVLPHSVVLHVHCVNSIAWAVRSDAPAQLKHRLYGLSWQWIPYVASGLPLSLVIKQRLQEAPDTDIFVLGNHGLVIAGEDAKCVDALLAEVEERLAIVPRKAHPPDYSVLMEICAESEWELPEDDAIHALGTDPIARAKLKGGVLYPCQAIFSRSSSGRFPFRIVEERGVVVHKSIQPAELAMVSGLAQVVQRIEPSAPLQYLAEAEVAALLNNRTHRYRQLASAGRAEGRS
jgi:rhamnose utilization protein RhaD (predicted bifunctional aldolase and dehydrogenase)